MRAMIRSTNLLDRSVTAGRVGSNFQLGKKKRQKLQIAIRNSKNWIWGAEHYRVLVLFLVFVLSLVLVLVSVFTLVLVLVLDLVLVFVFVLV